jgi:hypothetical protein
MKPDSQVATRRSHMGVADEKVDDCLDPDLHVNDPAEVIEPDI